MTQRHPDPSNHEGVPPLRLEEFEEWGGMVGRTEALMASCRQELEDVLNHASHLQAVTMGTEPLQRWRLDGLPVACHNARDLLEGIMAEAHTILFLLYGIERGAVQARAETFTAPRPTTPSASAE